MAVKYLNVEFMCKDCGRKHQKGVDRFGNCSKPQPGQCPKRKNGHNWVINKKW